MRELQTTFSHAQEGYLTFPCGEVGNCLPKGDIDQNVILDTKGKYTLKDMARQLPARSLHLSAANVHRSGAKELSGPTKGATEAAR